MIVQLEQFLKSVKWFSDRNCGKNKKLTQFVELERLPKSVKRFSDKRRGGNKGLEQERDSKIAHFALGKTKTALENFSKKWRPIFRQKMRQNKNPESTAICPSEAGTIFIKSLLSCRRLRCVGVFLLLLFLPSTLWAETRSLKIYYIHTREKAEIAYKKDGRYLDAGLKKLNYLLRDWRRNEPTNMDPRLFDLIWQVYKLSGSRDYIHVVSAYRSPATNNMLRSRSASSGVAKNSQHTLGKALDFYLPDVNLAKLRGLGLRQESGGVGYYPTSGSPFVHMDVGSVRHWPRMNRKELMALFPDGKTVHVPSDGKPLEGYNQALAAYNARKGALPSIVVAREEKKKNKAEKTPLFAGLFGNKKNKTPKQQATTVAAARPPIVAVQEQNQGVQVILPDEEIPIPTFSPLKKSRDGKEQEDAIAALLVAQNALDEERLPVQPVSQNETSSPIFATGFAPVPVLKMRNPSTIVMAAQEASTDGPQIQPQMAALPSLDRSDKQVPRPKIIPPQSTLSKQESTDEPSKIAIETVIAKVEDRASLLPQEPVDAREDLMLETDMDDLLALDQDMIRALIIDSMATIEADNQMVASITPRTAPKADKPRLDELAQLIAKDEAQRQVEMATNAEEIYQIPELVFVSGLQKNKKQPAIATLGGKAINFPPVARIATGE